jgi:hypothetical protein
MSQYHHQHHQQQPQPQSNKLSDNNFIECWALTANPQDPKICQQWQITALNNNSGSGREGGEN